MDTNSELSNIESISLVRAKPLTIFKSRGKYEGIGCSRAQSSISKASPRLDRLSNLTPALLYEFIFAYLDGLDLLAHLPLVCRQWKLLLLDNSLSNPYSGTLRFWHSRHDRDRTGESLTCDQLRTEYAEQLRDRRFCAMEEWVQTLSRRDWATVAAELKLEFRATLACNHNHHVIGHRKVPIRLSSRFPSCISLKLDTSTLSISVNTPRIGIWARSAYICDDRWSSIVLDVPLVHWKSIAMNHLKEVSSKDQGLVPVQVDARSWAGVTVKSAELAFVVIAVPWIELLGHWLPDWASRPGPLTFAMATNLADVRIDITLRHSGPAIIWQGTFHAKLMSRPRGPNQRWSLNEINQKQHRKSSDHLKLNQELGLPWQFGRIKGRWANLVVADVAVNGMVAGVGRLCHLKRASRDYLARIDVPTIDFNFTPSDSPLILTISWQHDAVNMHATLHVHDFEADQAYVQPVALECIHRTANEINFR